ncbi:MAG: abortive infection system antitoxin AbiGi family protein [Desulfosalsimonadaceae bacterium]
MPLSANTLFHFTKEKDTLKKILEENFRIFNCKETITFGADKTILHIPLVSFCDIPLSEVKDHMLTYGSYGIGMTKDWRMRKGLNPVLYVAQNSNLSISYKIAFNYFTKDPKNNARILDNLSLEQKALADVLRYIKNYEADHIRENSTTPNYRFSDEREWRYVPPHSEACDMFRSEAWYAKPDNKDASDAKLVALRLNFEPNDIKYIIINDDSEIREFINYLKQVKGEKYTLHDVERLTTRILTAEQIKGDM